MKILFRKHLFRLHAHFVEENMQFQDHTLGWFLSPITSDFPDKMILEKHFPGLLLADAHLPISSSKEI
jgi:hypothetical protein